MLRLRETYLYYLFLDVDFHLVEAWATIKAKT